MANWSSAIRAGFDAGIKKADGITLRMVNGAIDIWYHFRNNLIELYSYLYFSLLHRNLPFSFIKWDFSINKTVHYI